MALYHYPYHFVQRVYPHEDNGFLNYKLLYAFKSPKSYQWYWAWVEVYEKNFYAIKFHLKTHRDSPNKYSLLTGLNEARPVINTCVAIMLEIANRDNRSSFGFIGANMVGETEVNTKRFRVYKKFMATYFSEALFIHLFNVKKSSYVLIRKDVIATTPNIIAELDERFRLLYPYFE